ncbi:hypothetical protein VTL71DRAFT_3018 [Oculimacula yallundae]|uniref:RRM domain-containing protein n=1 Tax=Oculimacula yallundae TaxID=86028 RepID=A0ABR4C5X6_9HELO
MTRVCPHQPRGSINPASQRYSACFHSTARLDFQILSKDHFLSCKDLAMDTPAQLSPARQNDDERRDSYIPVSSGPPNPDHKAIRCGNLRPEVNVEQLRDHFVLSAGFQHAYLPLKNDGTAMGHGIVSFEDYKSAHMAQQTLNGTKLNSQALDLMLTISPTPDQIKSSQTADTLILSAQEIHRIESAGRKAALLQDLEDFRVECEKDRPLFELEEAKRFEARNHPRIRNLVRLIGGEDSVPVAMAIDKMVVHIDSTYRHESELNRNFRLWGLLFDEFDDNGTTILKERPNFCDKHKFKPSPADDRSTKFNRVVLFSAVANLAGNNDYIRHFEKLFQADIELPQRDKRICEIELQEARRWIIKEFCSVPDWIIDWDSGYNACFEEVNALLAHIELFKEYIRMVYREKIEEEQKNGSNQPSFVPREWDVEDSMNKRIHPLPSNSPKVERQKTKGDTEDEKFAHGIDSNQNKSMLKIGETSMEEKLHNGKADGKVSQTGAMED